MGPISEWWKCDNKVGYTLYKNSLSGWPCHLTSLNWKIKRNQAEIVGQKSDCIKSEVVAFWVLWCNKIQLAQWEICPESCCSWKVHQVLQYAPRDDYLEHDMSAFWPFFPGAKFSVCMWPKALYTCAVYLPKSAVIVETGQLSAHVHSCLSIRSSEYQA